MATTQKIQIVNHNQNENATYGTMNVPEPKNFTRNGAYISQYKYNMSDLNENIESAVKFFSGDKNNGGFAAQLLSCVEIDWGDAIEGWTLNDGKNSPNWDDGNHKFPEKIKTSADLLQYIFMLRWKLDHISVTPASYTLSLNPTTLTITYKNTGTITATASQSNTSATIKSYAWSFPSGDTKFGISDKTVKTPTISHLETLTSSWKLPTPTGAVTQQMSSATGNAKVACTAGDPTEVAPTASQSTLTCKVEWTDGHIESKTATIKSSGYDNATKPTVKSYSWAITSNSSYATLSNSTAETCTVTGKNTTTSAKTVKVVCTVTWSTGSKDTAAINVSIPPVEEHYYWYIGQINPSSIGTIQNDTELEGWREIGTSISGWSFEVDNTNKIKFNDYPATHQYYIVIPDSLRLYFADDTLAEGVTFESVSTSITGYKAWHYTDTATPSAKGFKIKK